VTSAWVGMSASDFGIGPFEFAAGLGTGLADGDGFGATLGLGLGLTGIQNVPSLVQ